MNLSKMFVKGFFILKWVIFLLFNILCVIDIDNFIDKLYLRFRDILFFNYFVLIFGVIFF